MLNDKNIYVIIGAAGSGTRMAASLPKQFLKIGEATILEQTVNQFIGVSLVDKIVIVTAKAYIDQCCQFFHEEIASGKILVVEGGKERQDSIGNALEKIECLGANPEDIVLIHDGVRPFVSKELIEAVTYAAEDETAAIAAIRPKDTIRHQEDGTLDRSKLYCVQTPQGFQLSVIRKAFDQAKKDNFYGTDDASLVERLGYHIDIVPGEEANIKITTREDIPLETRIGTGFDVHQLVEDRKLILGGVTIPYEKGLLGHSDADVLTHALMDAILGAAALGDIGTLFPDHEAAYEGISSIKLLAEVKRAMEDADYTLGNADMTVICQRPKLAAFIPQMRMNIAETLGVGLDKISIKATTTEKLGFVGRGEGIGAEAVCLLKRSYK
ncbi:2-C-methyl-D-erythritol 4-phosphate cytidylyltransferase/2-C-methyl-D-erythritol 2,4-cyclodiphosphate synthase [Clostridiales Family XIII bacterium PM5-7]